MAYRYYGYYSAIGELPPENIDPGVYGLGETTNPVHADVGIGFRPDFPPLYNPDNATATPGFASDWDYECQIDATPREQAQIMIGVQDRVRDTQRTRGVPIDRLSWAAHADTGYDHGVTYQGGPYLLGGSPEVVATQQQTAVYYGETWQVERRDAEVTPTERSYAGGGNFVPGLNSLPANNVGADRWNRDQPSDDFGPGLRQGVDVIVTVDRDMIQPYGGNLADGLIRYPHPMFDNIAAVPQAPSQWPDGVMGDVDPYLPGGGMYSDRQREVIMDPMITDSENLWASDVPDPAASYAGSWE